MLIGARAVIASVWDVADEPTALLAGAYYQALVDQPTLSSAEALRRAQLAVRAADGGRWAHEGFWAGFSVLGV